MQFAASAFRVIRWGKCSAGRKYFPRTLGQTKNASAEKGWHLNCDRLAAASGLLFHFQHSNSAVLIRAHPSELKLKVMIRERPWWSSRRFPQELLQIRQPVGGRSPSETAIRSNHRRSNRVPSVPESSVNWNNRRHQTEAHFDLLQQLIVHKYPTRCGRRPEPCSGANG